MSIRDPARWKRAQEIFLDASERPKPEQDTFVAETCGDDTEMARVVHRMLESEQGEARFIEDAIAEGGRLLDPEPPMEPEISIGDFVGPYRLVRLLGRGGMGVVYLAERADRQFEKQVALKLVAPGRSSKTLRQRFHDERQILADLDHPSIARLLDGGSADDGRPFLVMEYVEGEPIDQHCQARNLGLGSRLQLFRQVLDAVEHAHRHLVVHRDIKPANILVTPEGSVKLLDFGIAKLLDTAAAAAGSQTSTVSMTPQYASPEQVRGSALTTASDVYALGLVLYRMLTGTKPYDLRDAAPAEVVRVVCDLEPELPSEAVRRDPQATAIAAARLAGDLDAIVMKALRKEAGARYSSVGQLAQDLDHFLEGRPVGARRGGNIYRLRKFVTRHRAATAATLVAALGAGLFTARVMVERDRAEQAVTLLGDFMGFAAPVGESRRIRIATEQRFDERTDALVSRLEGRPRLQGHLLRSVGSLYHMLGMNDRARRQLEKAVDLGRNHDLGLTYADVLRTHGELLRDDGDFDQAESELRQALTIHRRAGGDSDPLREAMVLDFLATVILDRDGDAEEAVNYYRQSLELKQSVLGDDAWLVAESKQNVAQALQQLERFDESEAAFREALTVYRRELGDDPDVAMVIGNLGNLLADTGRAEEAEAALREALEIDLRHYRPDHRVIAQDRDNLAWALRLQADFEAAETEYLEALEIRRKIYGESHPDTIEVMGNLADLYSDSGRYEQAVASLRFVMERFGEILQADHPHHSQARISLAVALVETGNQAEAESLLREAAEMRRSSPAGEKSLAVADVEIRLGSLLVDGGRYAEARTFLTRALQILRDHFDDRPQYIARTLLELGRVHRATGNCVEAQPMLRESLALREANGSAGTWRQAATAVELGACLAIMGDADEARALISQAIDPLQEAGRDREVQMARSMIRRIGPS